MVRRRIEPGHERQLATLFGTVTVARIAYRAPLAANLHPIDAASNLPIERASFGLRKLAAIEAVRGSFDDAKTAIERAACTRIGNRQIEQQTERAAVDIEVFYRPSEQNALRALMYLTVLRWPGDIPTAVEVLSRLAHNAVIHARPDIESEADGEMTVRLAVADDNVLLVDVEDRHPEFPDSQAAIEGEKGRSLTYVRLLSAQVTWFLCEDTLTKTVQARLLPDAST